MKALQNIRDYFASKQNYINFKRGGVKFYSFSQAVIVLIVMAASCIGIGRLNSLNPFDTVIKLLSVSASKAEVPPMPATLLTDCTDTTYINIHTDSLSNVLSLLPPTGPVNMKISGTLTVDVNWYIAPGSDIILDDISGIDVKPGVFLSADSTVFRGCDYLWRSIEIESGAIGKFYKCKFSDALYALDYNNLSYMGIANCDFDNNFVGVRCNNTSGGVGHIYWASDDYQFINNRFNGGSLNLFSGYDNDWVLGGGKTYAGLILNNISHFVVGDIFAMGTPYQYNNQFKNGVFGILSNESSVTLMRSSFGNNIVGLQEIASTPGHFINVLGGSSKLVDFRTHEVAAINVSGFDKGVTPVDFTSFDVSMDGSDVKVSNTKFIATSSTTPNGIRFEGLKGMDVEIDSNEFVNCLIGIEATGTGGMENYKVTNNTYDYVDYYPGSNIKKFFHLVKSSNPADKVICTDNTIEANGSFYAIELLYLKNLEISDNTIQCSLNTQYDQFYGIRLVGCDKAIVSGNIVQGPGDTYAYSKAYSFYATNGNAVCNYSNATYEGMRFDFDSYPSRVYSNHFYEHYNGFVLDYYAMLGLQDNHQNQWYGNPYDGDGAFVGEHYSDPSIGSSMSQFYIATSIPIQTNKYWPNTVSVGSSHSNNGVGSWFQSMGSQKPECISIGESLVDTMHQLSYITDQDRYIAKGDSLRNDAASWGLRWGLYDKLYNAPSLISMDTLTDAFYSHENSGNLGKIFEIKYLIENLKNLPEFIDYREQHKDIISQKETIIEAELLVHTSLTPGAKDTAMQNLNTQIAVLDSMLNESQALADDMQLAFTTAQADMQSIRASMSNMNQIERNFSIVYGIITDHLNDTEFSLSQNETDSLYYVAEQCYGTGGRAVLDARHLLQILGLEPIFDDDCYIEPRSEEIQSQDKAESSAELTFNNPAAQILNYHLKGVDYKESELLIQNLTGDIVFYKKAPDQQGKIDIANIPNGFYIIIWKTGEQYFAKKLIIQQ